MDSSALVKLIVPEAETPALEAEAAGWDRWLSSALAGVEVRRALGREDATDADWARGERVLAACTLVKLDEPVLQRAAALRPWGLRSLDALHLASALEVGSELDHLVAYDRRLLEAAQLAGLTTLSPGAVSKGRTPPTG